MHSPLILQAVLGVSADRTAEAFLVPGKTMGQRLVRVKAKILQAGIPFELPSRSRFPDLLPDEPEVRGMLALHLGIEARSAARRDGDGQFVDVGDRRFVRRTGGDPSDRRWVGRPGCGALGSLRAAGCARSARPVAVRGCADLPTVLGS
ncbi:putative RNA polymerase sigma factor [Nakamurella sp. UYEF19]|uniref:hypothetical protein n=1 Tax=Nakamurella sp. UYEF19 TaxID=1756392 RepID=UPI0033933F29